MISKDKNPYASLFKILTILSLFGFFLLQGYGVDAADLKFSWEPPAGVNPDHIGGYYIYWGTESKNYVKRVHIGKVYEATIKELIEGNTYYFAVTSYYIGAPDIESDFSNEIAKTIAVSTPAPVAGAAIIPPATSTPAPIPDSTIIPPPASTPVPMPPVSPEQTFANRQPIADAGVDQIEVPGTFIVLDGTRSSDPDGDILSYSWTQLGGRNVNLNGTDSSQAAFTLPMDSVEGQIYSFQLTVKDPGGLQSTATCSVGTSAPPGTTAVTTDTAGTPEGIDISGTWGPIATKKQGRRIMIFSSFKLSNLGAKDVSSVKIRFYQSIDNHFDESDYKLAEYDVRDLKAGATVDLGLRIEYRAIGSEDRLIAVIDPTDDLKETNEENNIVISSVVR